MCHSSSTRISQKCRSNKNEVVRKLGNTKEFFKVLEQYEKCLCEGEIVFLGILKENGMHQEDMKQG